jgi:hypothetical protein
VCDPDGAVHRIARDFLTQTGNFPDRSSRRKGTL